MIVLAIDPGPEQSAWLNYDMKTDQIVSFGLDTNEFLRRLIESYVTHRESGGTVFAHQLVIEQVASFGMPVGKEIFETVFWSGRFAEVWASDGSEFSRLTRIAVKNHLCHSSRAKDSNIRQALIDRFGPPGTKKNPGATYRISKDLWSALALAVTFSDNYHNGGK